MSSPVPAASVGPVRSAPAWVEHVLWWQVFPLGFVGAEAEQLPTDSPVRHRLDRLVGWLDHLIEIGASGLALGPVFASGTHGYDTIDPFRIDPRLGDEADLDRLIEQAHARGIRVLLDGVFNHVGRDFPRFARILAEGRTAPDQDWFTLYWPEGSDDAEVPAEPGYNQFEGHPGLVELDHSNPAVIDFVVSVMRFWLDRGIDGWRLDAAYAVPTGFWAQVISQVHASHPEAYLVGEVIHGDYAGIVASTGMDAVTQYELWKAIRSSLAERNLWELAWSLKRHAEFLDAFVPLTFVGNHDVTRIASALPDSRHVPHALAILMLVGGTPTIYYGDEEGFAGVKEDRVGGDDAVRPEFPADAAGLDPAGADTRRVHQELIGLRRRHPWLHRARTTAPTLENTRAVLESAWGDERLWLALNLDDDPCDLAVPGAAAVAAGAGSWSDGTVTVPPHGWVVLSR